MEIKKYKYFTLYCLIATAFLLIHMGGTIVAGKDIGLISVLLISGFTAFSLLLWDDYESQMEKEMQKLRLKIQLMEVGIDNDKEMEKIKEIWGEQNE